MRFLAAIKAFAVVMLVGLGFVAGTFTAVLFFTVAGVMIDFTCNSIGVNDPGIIARFVFGALLIVGTISAVNAFVRYEKKDTDVIYNEPESAGKQQI